MTDVKLPPLPVENYVDDDGLWCERYGPYDAETTKAYARTAVLQERARCAKVCEKLAASGFSATPSELHMWNCAKQDCADAIRKGE